jgi:hypothetical protein
MTPNSIIKLKGEDLPQPRNGAPTTSDSYVSQLREEQGTLGFDGVVKFDGTGDNLSLTLESGGIGSGDFTLEYFVYQNTLSDYQTHFATTRGSTGFNVGTDASGDFVFYDQVGSSARKIEVVGAIGTGRWYHWAFVRSGSTITGYLDGKSMGTYTSSADYSATTCTIGSLENNSEYVNGYMSNLRFIKGTAVYTAAFTPPSEPLTNVTNTKLLCCNSSTSATAATVTPGTITANGNAFATRNELTGPIVLAIPGISGGQGSGFGDYSADIKGSGTNKTILTTNSPTISSNDSLYYGSSIKLVRASAQNVYTTSINETIGTGDFTLEGWFRFDSRNEDINAFNLYSGNTRKFFLQMRVSSVSLDFHTRVGVNQVQYNSGTVGWSDAHIGNWYHIATVMDSGTFSIFLNGVCVGAHTNVVEDIGTVDTLRIGYMSGDGTKYLDGYFQDFRFYNIAKYKGGFDVPKPYTPVGIEAFRTTADTCKNNFATMNPLIGATQRSGSVNSTIVTYTDGNLTTRNNASSAWAPQMQSHSNFGMTTGKWYWECSNFSTTSNEIFGISKGNEQGSPTGSGSGIESLISLKFDGQIYIASQNDNGGAISPATATISNSAGTAMSSTSDVVGFAFDADNSSMTVYLNGVLNNTATNIVPTARSVDKPWRVTKASWGSGVVSGMSWNFGQNPSFSGTVTAGTNADGNGKGLFKYAPPTGFLALCEDNLPTPAIADPGKHFKTVLYTGSGSVRGIVGVGFKPDLVWIKERTSTSSHHIFDSVRGATLRLFSNSDSAESSSSTQLYSFDSDGFSNGTSGGTNQSGEDYVAWCWKAGGAAVSNTDGSITTQVSVNQTAGFSIATYTGTGANATIGHGLGVAPAFAIFKATNSVKHWLVYHQSLGETHGIYLSLTGDSEDLAQFFNDTAPSSTTISIGTNSGINLNNTTTYVAYSWAEIEGYSKFGSYTGNGNADGPFVYCGFKPAFVMVKSSTSTTNWLIMDNARNSTNPVDLDFYANLNNIESQSPRFDYVSNGFKVRNTSSEMNTNNATYIFMAFAESPFQTANAK